MRDTRSIGAGFLSELYRVASAVCGACLVAIVFSFTGAPHENLWSRPQALAGDLAFELAIFGGMAALMARAPTRALVEGWLGMLAGRVPSGFEERADNLGRAACGALAAVVGLALPLGLLHDSTPAFARAIGVAIVVVALLVYGPGAAVPRLWFATRHGGGSQASGPPPELFERASIKATAFVLCAFVGIEAGLSGGMVGLPTANARHQADERAADIALAAIEAPAAKDLLSIDGLCEPPSAGCGATRHLVFTAGSRGRAKLALMAREGSGVLVCHVEPDGAWPSATPWTAEMDRTVNSGANIGEIHFDVEANERLGLVVSLPGPVKRCGYMLLVDQPGSGE